MYKRINGGIHYERKMFLYIKLAVSLTQGKKLYNGNILILAFPLV